MLPVFDACTRVAVHVGAGSNARLSLSQVPWRSTAGLGRARLRLHAGIGGRSQWLLRYIATLPLSFRNCGCIVFAFSGVPDAVAR